MTNSPDTARLLGTRRYGAFWFASLLSNIGTWMQSVAEPWLVLSISGSSFLLGLDAFAMNAPFWILTLVGGVLADRKDRSRIIYFFQGIQMLCPLLIVALVAAGWIKVGMIITVSLIVGITDALSVPAFSSLIPSIVESKDLKPALALNSVQFNLSRVLGPAIAGLVMMKYGFLWCFGANAASYVPFFLSIYWLSPRARVPLAKASVDQDLGSTIDGIKSIATSVKIAPVLASVFSTAFFCGPLITFSPVIVKNVLHADVGQFGNVLTAFGIGGTVVCAPLRVCLIELQPGEKLVGEPQIGDSVRWNVAPATYGKGEDSTAMLVLKPQMPGLDTNLLITTDRRAYYVRLVSKADDYVSRVAFVYNDDDGGKKWKDHFAEQKQAELAAARDASSSQPGLPVAFERLHFDYQVKGGDENSRPLRVFDDGSKTYIQMPANIANREAPVLVVLGPDGKGEVVNYRMKEQTYIVDRLFEHAQLVLGSGKKAQKVEISHDHRE